MNPDLRSLITLQNIDQRIISLRKQIAEIPDKAQASRAEHQQMAQAHQSRVALDQELAKRRRTRESEVEMMQTRLSRLKDQLMTVKTNKEYTAMLHEIQTAEQQIHLAEDGILEIMEQMESMEGKLLQAGNELKTREAELEVEIRNAEQLIPMLETEVQRLGEEKKALEGRIDADLLGRYRRIADARKGIALAEAREELCAACHVRIRPQVLADLLRTEEIHVCDSCSRILFFRESL